MKNQLAHVVVASALLLGACTHAPDSRHDPRHARAADIAVDMAGKPYWYGGAGPQGFDCSGLVYYSYRRAGLALPRNTEGQREAVRRVARHELKKGDLVFFNQEGKRFSHVGLYLGNGNFVHAPSSGKRVRVDQFDDPYWRRHFAGAGRVVE